MKYLTLLIGLLTISSFSYGAGLPISTSPDGASVYIISPENGEIVGELLTVKFGLQGMGISPAGLDKANTGHHHLIIDGKKLPDFDKAMGSEVVHFGGGQTQKTIKLSKGKHTLQLILGNYLHVPHNPPVVSEKITVYVK
ncbi:hypothetical protein PCNPT3_04620 [Psychromonas sp. CNPT3]|uniref:DUF4399 domain-containing protein n=1 Tax=Psychromonas sp. CNPT3 TaxID=314282 RepID=UPI00006E5666|nr:DUF4399 domain-containing protein [Psychromonas sp. CNPT3]AGH80866.1 hypothetical protein PCNPT3_04620 [Psychromonas sp. CNPT3]